MAQRQSGERNKFVPELVRIGHVHGAHGVQGAIRVKLDNPESGILRRIERLTLTRAAETAEYRVVGVQLAGQGTFKICLEGVSRVDDAIALRGAVVMVPSATLPPIDAGEFYYFEAIGCRVVTTSGVAVGIIEEIFCNGANDVWVVRDDSAEHLVPVIEDIVKELDLAARRIIIEAVPGLLG